MYLNMVDMDQTLTPVYTHPIMTSAMQFIDSRISTKMILIHCNLGQSRAPSIALVYLARKGVISRVSYDKARAEFVKVYQRYHPAKGIVAYLRLYWDELMKL